MNLLSFVGHLRVRLAGFRSIGFRRGLNASDAESNFWSAQPNLLRYLRPPRWTDRISLRDREEATCGLAVAEVTRDSPAPETTFGSLLVNGSLWVYSNETIQKPVHKIVFDDPNYTDITKPCKAN